MVSSNIEVEGLGQLQKDLSGIKDKLTKKELQAILRPGIKVMQRAIKQRAPVRTGALKRAIRVKAGKGRANAPYASMWTAFGKTVKNREGKMVPPYYGYFLENGTVIGQKNRPHRRSTIEQRLARGGRMGIQPRPFVWPAFEATYQQVADVILDNIEKSL